MLSPENIFPVNYLNPQILKKGVSIKQNGKFPSFSVDTIEGKEIHGLHTLNEIENEEKLFWFSYDEDLKAFPNKIKVEKMTLTLKDEPFEPKEILRKESLFFFFRDKMVSKGKMQEIPEKETNKNNNDSDSISNSSEGRTEST